MLTPAHLSLTVQLQCQAARLCLQVLRGHHAQHQTSPVRSLGQHRASWGSLSTPSSPHCTSLTPQKARAQNDKYTSHRCRLLFGAPLQQATCLGSPAAPRSQDQKNMAEPALFLCPRRRNDGSRSSCSTAWSRTKPWGATGHTRAWKPPHSTFYYCSGSQLGLSKLPIILEEWLPIPAFPALFIKS